MTACCEHGFSLGRRKLISGAAGGLLLGTSGWLAGCAALKSGGAPLGREFVVRNAHIATLDRSIGDIASGDIHVRDGAIVAVRPRIDAPGAEVLDASGMVAIPGFIDTHFHLWNTTLRNMQRHGQEYFPVKEAFVRHFTVEDHYRANRLALAECINAGITAVTNFSHNIRSPAHADAELRALEESGIRARYCYGWADPTPRSQAMDFADVKRVQTQWFGPSSPLRGRADLGIAMRGVRLANEEVVTAEYRFAREMGLPTILHTGATKRLGQSVARIAQIGHIDRSTILAHWIFQKEADLDALLKSGASVSFSPTSDLRTPYDNSFQESLLGLRERKVNLCMSIDAAMLGGVSMFEQMATAWYMGVPHLDTATEKLPLVDFTYVLEMATINGARALGWADRVGTITPGKRADLVLVRTTDLNIAPLGEVHSALARAATVANVDTVICDGRVLKRGGRLVGIDVQQVVAEAEQSLAGLRSRAGPNWQPKALGPEDREFAMLGACA
jgi:cytosine/adenosine deaminase-related metal-dependent hydrolase